MIVRCESCVVTWDMDFDPPGCTDPDHEHTLVHGETARPQAFDPQCGRFAWEMTDYDYLIENLGDLSDQELANARDDACWAEEGTLNAENGHFLCMSCYIAAGQPSSARGWVCP